MERRMHLAGTAVPEPLKWPSIAAASTELRRPRHLHVVPSAAPKSRSAAPGSRPPTLIDSRRR
jgi:hypothetical protein